ncbi:hypothetical protein [Algihabitans albus]|uniref:hypothetical protein n=1 Tax=Algihabitans albus TaxID=2164067 RepID=UPI0013C31B0D|nr:hypothetical protein [Algihabitans albus]
MSRNLSIEPLSAEMLNPEIEAKVKALGVPAEAYRADSPVTSMRRAEYEKMVRGLRGLPARPRLLHVGAKPFEVPLALARGFITPVLVVSAESEQLAELGAVAEAQGIGHLIRGVAGDPLLPSAPRQGFDAIWIGQGVGVPLDADAFAAWRLCLKPFGWLVLVVGSSADDEAATDQQEGTTLNLVQGLARAAGFAVSVHSLGQKGDRMNAEAYVVARKLDRDLRPEEL